MKPHLTLLVAAAAVAGMLAFQTTRPDDTLPPDHPPLNPLPPGHPPLPVGPEDRDIGPPPPAAPEDVVTPAAIVSAYYESISGAAGEPRDWDRFRSLFLPRARLMTVIIGTTGASPVMIAPREFGLMNDRYFTASGYAEKALEQRIDEFGSLAHVWSTYESRRGEDGPAAKGVNSFQILRGEGRWWIADVAWERDRRDPLPPGHP